MEIANSSRTKLNALRTRADRLAEALEKGLKMPWRGVRPDLVLHKGVPKMDRENTYVLEDPVRGAHFELGEAESRLFLCLVTERDLKAAVRKLLSTTSLRPSAEDLLGFLRMLQKEKLAVLPPEVALQGADLRIDRKPSLGKVLFKRYLFFKVPLLRPNRVLDALFPWVRPLWSPPFLFLYAAMGLVGLAFLSQQFELYFHSVNHLFTPRGAGIFFVSLCIVKTLHEFGHAMAARNYNLHVRRIGIGFMVFMPIMYTDVTEAWKLPSRKARLIIGGAGMMVELCIAAVSLFFWTILPDGVLRSLMFYFSGVSLVSTFLMNLNPLMRFDGYYILMDYLSVSNLRKRAMDMFKYHWRRLAVDWRGEKPEEHPWEQGLAVFGLFTIIYRFMIFFGIALLIYHLLPKLIGVINLVFSIGFFLVLPFTMEVFHLARSRDKWGHPFRVAASVLVFAGVLGLMALPVSRAEKLPGLFLYGDVAVLESPGRGRITTPFPEIGTRVARGDLLLRISDDALERELRRLTFELEKVVENLKTIGGGGTQGGYRNWLMAERERLERSVEKTRERIASLEIVAPVDGTVLDVPEYLGKGAYVGRNRYLLTVGNEQNVRVRAYAGESVYRNLRNNEIHSAEVVFKDLETPTMEALFLEMFDFPVVRFPSPALFDFAGGPLMSQSLPEGGVQARLPQYPLVFAGADDPRLPHGTPCTVKVKGKPASVFGAMVQTMGKALAGEGFI